MKHVLPPLIMHRGASRFAIELDRTTLPAFREGVAAYQAQSASADSAPIEPRSYPGYPRVPLLRVRPRTLASLESAAILDRALLERRSPQHRVGAAQPERRVLSRLLQYAHGVCGPDGRGPVPSAGGLQGLELYCVALAPGWLAAGAYHYDRAGHHLSQIALDGDGDGDGGRAAWAARVPSLDLIEGGALLWVLVGDVARVEAKYGSRAARFLLLEAGHLMQNLCLLSYSLSLTCLPLGGYLEPELAAALHLPARDCVLYTGVCGAGR